MPNRNRGTDRYVQGAGELANRLASMAEQARSVVVAAGVAAAVLPVEDAMIGYCPVRSDTVKVGRRKLQPGEMKASIRSKVVAYPNDGRAVGLVGPSGRAGRVAHLVEFGHLVVAPNKGQTIRRGNATIAANGVTHVPPHPFIRPAVLTTLPIQAAAFAEAAEAEYLKSTQQG